jgi:hypothetical protein
MVQLLATAAEDGRAPHLCYPDSLAVDYVHNNQAPFVRRGNGRARAAPTASYAPFYRSFAKTDRVLLLG